MAVNNASRSRNPRIKKGEQPEWLKEHSFAVKPENINKYGVPTDVLTLRKMIQNMGNEEVTIEIGKGKNKKVVTTTRFMGIIIDWFTSQSFEKQQAIMQYGLGKVPDKMELTGRDGEPLIPQVIEVIRSVKSDD